jgi:hypothetical protein
MHRRVHGYTAERTAQFLTQLRRRVAGLPGVASAACTDVLPLSEGGRRDEFHVDGRPNANSPDPGVDLYMVTPGYFRTLGIPLIAGRDFTDETAGPRLAVVSEAFVERLG